ncbi:MAG: PEP/pyruvate-binding domain-containing protein [Thermomicrobiales bacterium]|nr:PEP/pyruvate-binding domain-containing protein [Thermomicrobiales bacterium]
MSTARLLVHLDGTDHSIELIGGKAASLSRLRSLGAPVPPALALTTSAYRLYARRIGIPERSSRVALAELPDIRAAILDAPMPPEIASAISEATGALSSKDSSLLAVRSSATTEDSPEFSFAGLHDTTLSVAANPSRLESAVRTCWASLWSERSVDYRRRGGAALDSAAMAVVLQQLVRSDVSFVAFSANPVDHCARQVVISSSWGLGETIVAGLVVPDHILVGNDGAIETYQIGSKLMMIIAEPDGGVRQVPVPRQLASRQSLTRDQATSIGAMVRDLERRFGTPLDIEGGIAGGATFLFQARPITTCQHMLS